MQTSEKKALTYLIVITMIVLAAVIMVDLKDVEEESFTFPVMDIDTKDGADVTSHDDYLSCKISVSNTDEGFELRDACAGIRGRGNTTWESTMFNNMPKKPYKIKFDEPTELFGHGAYEKWTLIANYVDPSLCRNMFALAAAGAAGVEFESSTQCVHLYLNGEYKGLYLLCEQIEAGHDRVDVDTDYTQEDFGFLVELDRLEGDIGRKYFSAGGQIYHLRSPDSDDPALPDEKVAYVRDMIEEAWDAVVSGDYDAASKKVDMDSFASAYIGMELFRTPDNTSSFFLHRDVGGKLKAGPLWDFDYSSGNTWSVWINDTSNLTWEEENNIWFNALTGYPEFRERISVVLSERVDDIRASLDECRAYALEHRGDFEANGQRWDQIGNMVITGPISNVSFITWKDHLDYLCNWLDASLDTLVRTYCPELVRGASLL